MRDLADVITQLVAEIPPSGAAEKELVESLRKISGSVQWTAPEAMRSLWARTAAVLEEQVPSDADYREPLRRIFAGE